MRLFLSAFDKEILDLRYAVFRDDELLQMCAMLDDAVATVERYTNNAEHASALLIMHDLYADKTTSLIYSKMGQRVLLPLKAKVAS